MQAWTGDWNGKLSAFKVKADVVTADGYYLPAGSICIYAGNYVPMARPYTRFVVLDADGSYQQYPYNNEPWHTVTMFYNTTYYKYGEVRDDVCESADNAAVFQCSVETWDTSMLQTLYRVLDAKLT